MEIKILSWNIWADCNFAEVTEFLRTSNADIIGLQEVMVDDKKRDVVDFLGKLGYEHVVEPWGKIAYYGGRTMANGIFSRYPIIASKAHALSGSKKEEKRVAVEASIRVGNVMLTMLSLHIKHTHQKEMEIQKLQVENLIKVLPKEKVIVMGDFNATPDMTPIKRMREVLVDTNPDSTPTINPSFFDCKECDPKTIADTRLDYIFTSTDLKTHSPKVESPHGSDHLPISVTVEA